MTPFHRSEELAQLAVGYSKNSNPFRLLARLSRSFLPENYHEPDGRRIVKPVWINNVIAIQRGTKYPNRFIIMSGDIDSRISDPTNYTDDSPGANDNASGMAGAIEAARVLSQYTFENSIIYAGLAGEEQGLYGGKGLAEYAQKQGWEIIGILNNDMIGNIQGVDGVIDNRTFEYSLNQPLRMKMNALEKVVSMVEVDGVSRQLARYVHKMVKTYMLEMNPKNDLST